MKNDDKEIPVEVKNTTIQINSILAGNQHRENMIGAIKDELKKYEVSFQSYNAIKQKIEETEKHIKENRKLIETLVLYIDTNYNIEFTPGTLFEQQTQELN